MLFPAGEVSISWKENIKDPPTVICATDPSILKSVVKADIKELRPVRAAGNKSDDIHAQILEHGEDTGIN